MFLNTYFKEFAKAILITNPNTKETTTIRLTLLVFLPNILSV